MSTTIQNIACFEIRINPKSNRVYFNEDILQGKMIDKIWFFANSSTNRIKSPFAIAPGYPALITSDEVNSLGAYINLVDPDKNTIVNNLYIQNLIQTEDSYINNLNTRILELEVKRILDTKKSYLSTYETLENEVVLLVYVSYKIRPVTIKDNSVSGSYTIKIPLRRNLIIGDFTLSWYVDNTLRKYPVKQIIPSAGSSGSYLYLKAENSLIENIPLSRLNCNTTKEIFFDNLKIDFEQSFLKFRGGSSGRTETLTFIY